MIKFVPADGKRNENVMRGGVGMYSYRIAVCDDDERILVQMAEVIKKEFAKAGRRQKQAHSVFRSYCWFQTEQAALT